MNDALNDALRVRFDVNTVEGTVTGSTSFEGLRNIPSLQQED